MKNQGDTLFDNKISQDKEIYSYQSIIIIMIMIIIVIMIMIIIVIMIMIIVIGIIMTSIMITTFRAGKQYLRTRLLLPQIFLPW